MTQALENQSVSPAISETNDYSKIFDYSNILSLMAAKVQWHI